MMKLRYGFLAGSILSAPLVLSAFPSSAFAQPVQGLYVAGEGGATFNQDQQVRMSRNLPSGRDRWKTGAVGLGSVGYGLGNGFRVEVEGNYRNNDYKGLGTNTVSTKGDGRRQTSGVMVNALFDLDIGKSWLFPYFGAGVGYGWSAMRTTVTGLDRPLTEHMSGTFGGFAYQGIFGLAFPVPWVVGLSATAEYRFWTMLGPQSHFATAVGTVGGGDNLQKEYGVASGNHDTKTDFNHSLMLGLRYEFNPAPPPPPPSVAPTIAAPAPAAARTYLVFFDWDEAELSDRARSIVAVAAQASGHTAVTRIQVGGYTDTSAAHPGARGEHYNMELSTRRANAVKAELIRDGVAGSIIDVHGFGQTRPLVMTGPDVREPQNRRVEIILH